MKMKKKREVFHAIAPIYGLFYSFQKNSYRRLLTRYRNEFDFSQVESIVDIGCGTGALCSVFNELGIQVTAVDPIKRMLDIARKKNRSAQITYIQASAVEKLPFSDKSFDVAVASYVAHGLFAEDRNILYREMQRISRKAVVILDYNQNRSLASDFVEWLEGGDYFQFINVVKSELQSIFPQVKQITTGPRSAWYICRLKMK
jgi:ubiquinone/menaquinone biosynthesis C-methylase UbiE